MSEWWNPIVIAVGALLAGWLLGAMRGCRKWRDAKRNPPPFNTKVIFSYGIYVGMGFLNEDDGRWYDCIEPSVPLPRDAVHSWQYAPPARNYVDYDEVRRHGFF